ncbi:MAG: ABC transporter ATP-binding protein/permease [Anaerolineae bacterium]|jgi:ATP-binding cassette subfamily B protein|nr:ABC transporter ATP-binding protein/permease [Anaerolineae bacterium]
MGIFGGLNAEKYDRQYSDTYLAGRIARYMWRYRRQVMGIVASFTLLSITSSLQPILISAGVDYLEHHASAVVLILVALVVSATLEYFSNWNRRRLLSQVISRVVAQMREDAFEAAIGRDLAFYDRNKTGKIVSRITTDTQEFGDVLLFSSDVLSQMIALIVLVGVLFQQSLPLTILLLLTLPVFIVCTLALRSLARQVTRKGSRAMAVVNDNIQESVTGISVAKNFRREQMIYEEFAAVNKLSYQTNIRRGFVLAMVFPIMNFLVGAAIALVLYAGAGYVFVGVISAGAWFLFIQGVDRFLFPVINLASFWSQIQQGLSAAERVFSLIDAENTVIQTDQQSPGAIQGRIEFRNVTFRYADDLEPVLRNFNLVIEPKEDIAFVGHTGAGKSTIAKLVARFYEFQEGEILIDGRDIRTFDLTDYRSRLGIVPQQPFLFSGTVLDNIRYARPAATDEEIHRIAYSIGGGEWLEGLPDGLNSDAGERGARLSMGQRQLVSLLRVLIQQPAIFILDEATASVDPFTEMQIQEAIEKILAHSTSILIAHRLSTVRSADRIIVLKDGGIMEEGSHDHLMQQGGHYAELYNTYFRHQSLSYVENARTMLEQMEAAGD